MPGFHTKRSPSSAHRWRKCPGSVRMEEGLPDEAGEDAIQGTVFHEVAADCLETGLEPFHFIGERIEIEERGEVIWREFTREMAVKMLPGLDFVWALADSPGAKLYVEKRVYLDRWVGPGESGTADAFIVDPVAWRLTCFDWKWGAGVPVDPEWNDQAILYLLGVWDTYAESAFEQAVIEAGGNPNDPWEDAIECQIIIEQPRAAGGGGVWKARLGDLLREGRRIKRDAEKTEKPDAPLVPGEAQCKFCKAARANTCSARAEFIIEKIGADFDDLESEFAAGAKMEIADARALTPEQRSQILLNQPLIESFLTQLHEEAMEDARIGRPTPGLKRVAGRRPPRKWRDADKAEVVLSHDFGDEAWVRKLRSPSQIEEEAGKEQYRRKFEALVDEGEPKPILVPETDKREPLANIDQMFDDDDVI